MIRDGMIARYVIDELEERGCDTKVGCPDLKKALDDAEFYTGGEVRHCSIIQDSNHAILPLCKL